MTRDTQPPLRPELFVPISSFSFLLSPSPSSPHKSPTTSRSLCFHTLAHSFASDRKLNSFVFFQLRTLLLFRGRGSALFSSALQWIGVRTRNSFTCHTSEKCACNSFACHTSKTKDFKPCVCHTSEKRWGGGGVSRERQERSWRVARLPTGASRRPAATGCRADSACSGSQRVRFRG